jgi:hypothetical protein
LWASWAWPGTVMNAGLTIFPWFLATLERNIHGRVWFGHQASKACMCVHRLLTYPKLGCPSLSHANDLFPQSVPLANLVPTHLHNNSEWYDLRNLEPSPGPANVTLILNCHLSNCKICCFSQTWADLSIHSFICFNQWWYNMILSIFSTLGFHCFPKQIH